MAVLAGLLLVVFCIGVALYPFLKVRESRARTASSPSSQDLVERRRAIYADLETLELERGLGHIDDAEYEERFRGYRLAAAATFRDQELLQTAEAEVEEVISRELGRWRIAQQHGRSTNPRHGSGYLPEASGDIERPDSGWHSDRQ